jgi:5-hydroxyisourate hydrolase
MGKLTTHVLDTAHGLAAVGMQLRLYRLVGDDRQLLVEIQTNSDGRCAAPLLQGDDLQRGRYELQFAAGDYFRNRGIELPEPAFLEDISLHFGIADATSHYHVPLLVSPWSYSTYRGS